MSARRNAYTNVTELCLHFLYQNTCPPLSHLGSTSALRTPFQWVCHAFLIKNYFRTRYCENFHPRFCASHRVYQNIHCFSNTPLPFANLININNQTVHSYPSSTLANILFKLRHCAVICFEEMPSKASRLYFRNAYLSSSRITLFPFSEFKIW
ncbi:hypothetical protein CC80DRAFT_39162 [Byssothecium circinans]|uniref:Uncharacterized protein n=1 Tax=Byssothecium circinans TaxID=147558 RepID=A0A6A5U030_9PLEO|nr:hypothetical protein CC80DRAFT_39162 [Byssothecium circinans]